jgi:hypothetical protein
MPEILEVTGYYQQKIDTYNQSLSILKKKRSNIAWIRLGVVLITIVTVFLIRQDSSWLITASIIAGIALFLTAVSTDLKNKDQIDNTARLIAINEEEIEIIKGNYLTREDGKQFEPSTHPYANDLDIFGTASLYQYINRCNSEQGTRLLAANLLAPQTKENILSQQEAVKELRTKTDWHQQFRSTGIINPITLATEQKINTWLKESISPFTASYWQWLVHIYTVITIASGVLYALDVLPYRFFYLLVVLFAIFAFSLSRKVNTTWLLLSKVVAPVNTLYQQLHWLEKESFNSIPIITIKNSIKSKQGAHASGEILLLKKILDKFDFRMNVFVFFFVNIFLLWDVRQMLALNKWKKNNASNVNNWFRAIAQMEVSVSIATLAFNKPNWCVPEIVEDHFTFEGVAIGHPLIAEEKRVDNDYKMQGIGQVSLITGSNMGGKSTFLRSVGVNIVLALAGAPVCAASFIISPVKLMSSMRIADNLAESTSTFYAELKKLQTIIEAVNRKEKLFILLDEILRGTNSLDKHTGSEALIKQLIKQKAVAILATHDVELTKLESDFPQAITNYHFDVQVANDELYFDYKLKEGICTSMNASILMRKIGIEII